MVWSFIQCNFDWFNSFKISFFIYWIWKQVGNHLLLYQVFFWGYYFIYFSTQNSISDLIGIQSSTYFKLSLNYLVSYVSLKELSSQKMKFTGISIKRPKIEAFITGHCTIACIFILCTVHLFMDVLIFRLDVLYFFWICWQSHWWFSIKYWRYRWHVQTVVEEKTARVACTGLFTGGPTKV